MRKTVIILLIFVVLALKAQTNLQVHYDFGKNRHYVTTTLEMFKPDKWGNTFWFVDFDYNFTKFNHPSMAYFEIARSLKFWDGPLSAHFEYNGGLGNSDSFGYSINNAWLGGVNYDFHNADFSKTLTLQAMYKNIRGKYDDGSCQNSFQLTGVWNLNFFKKKLTVSGFADFLKEDNLNLYNANGDLISPNLTKYVFITEPQFWYNLSENLSLGSEIEIASNFASVNGFKVCPTLAAKWNF